MFTQLLNQVYPNNTRVPYSINERIDLARQYSNNHPIVEHLANYLSNNYMHNNIIYLSGDDLVRIWQGDELPFAEKYLSTLWWGGKTRHAASAYSVNNIERMGNPGLPAALQLVSDAKSLEEAKENLQIVYQSLERGGAFSLRQVGPSFFSKVLEYYFVSHPIQANYSYLPIICDQWLCRAVYAEMTERNEIDIRNTIFRTPTDFRVHWNSTWTSYSAFIDFFNRRVIELKEEFPDLTAFMLEGYLFSRLGREMANNFIN